ncbi:helix-turn-helix domain-containing protein [Aminobacter sp. MET-1]|uniref:helix-turn-helix domain-containing protein n=1 Tax=Aminobacter sp. MET-1 TaxID=2951085 RepID=UPI002269A966|nr:helix-turn-helix transcriptional regulator [Aminobacter sp. MET-1]MCX8571100.1 helix-turn-helix domain-containing protein [Aminobacter sp. MET-1]MCX8573231.1 helix-turn-helix domain-containing protein [Aminobacter sp. MET-1]
MSKAVDDEKLHQRLSKALIRIRDEHGLLNKEMAERLQVTEGYMSQVLRGRRDVRLSMLNRISKEFGVDASELIGDDDLDDDGDGGKSGGDEPGRKRRSKIAEPPHEGAIPAL